MAAAGVVLTGPTPDDPANVEQAFRKELARKTFTDPLGEIAKNHSIPVMDRECQHFLRDLPPGATILDIGGSWGWHWRKIGEAPCQPKVVLLDFVPENFIHAEKILGKEFKKSVDVKEGDATKLPFPDEIFDAVWTVQTFQHIRNFDRACREAWRVLKSGGKFINYSLHTPLLLRILYRLCGRKFHKEGEVAGRFYLRRADEEQKRVIEHVFRGPVQERFTECLFHPDLRITFTGKAGSWLGALDVRLGDFSRLGSLIARQRSFCAVKQ